MKFPSTLDFLTELGLEPTQASPGDEFFKYIRRKDDSRIRIEITFHGIEESFQAALYHEQTELAVISSERVSEINIRRESKRSLLHVKCRLANATSEALIELDPDVNLKWWTLAT